MKKYFKILTLLIVVLFSINTEKVYAIDNFEIDDLNVVINVNKDGSYDITEDYTLNFTAPGLGIYRDLTTISTMNWNVEGQEVIKKYNLPISDINVLGDEYYVESQLNGKRIVIGPDNGPRFTGEKKYTVSYTVLSKPIDISIQEEAFFYNLVSDWDAIIHNFSATVNFYDDVNIDELNVVGTTRDGNFTVPCDINSNQSFTCTYNEDVYFGYGNGITALVPLADDFYVRANSNYIYYSLLFLAIVLSGLFLVLWTKFGKDDPIIEVVSFKPPKGFNSAMVGYVYDDTVDNDDIYSLLFYWANDGLIEIREEKSKKIKFTKLQPIPADRPSFEKELFSMMFYKDGPITTKDWQKQDIYSKLTIAKSNVPNAVKKLGNIYTKESKKYQTLVAALGFLPLAMLVFISTWQNTLTLLLAVGYAAALSIFYFLAFAIFIGISNKSQNKKSVSVISTIIFIVVVSFGFVLANFIANQIFAININDTVFILISVFTSINIVIAYYMQKRSEFGSRVYGEILGLRAFIKYAKKDELLMMQAENPHLYYDVLPYAYAFSMSDLWNDQFRSIEIPQSPYYTTYRSSGFSNYVLMNSMLRSINQVPTQVMPKIQSGSGGASFGGGGFSGGGFSGGGGFGGGGGGGR